MQLTGGEIVVEALHRAAVPYVVGVPGPSILPLLDAFVGREDRIRFIATQHEGAAVHLADGYFRAGGAPLAVVIPTGPGALAAAAALATSHMESTAVLCLTGAPHTYLVGRGVHQEIARGRGGHALPNALAPVVKRQWCVAGVAQLASVMPRAFAEMLHGRPGPVHVDIPVDIQATAEEVDLPEHLPAPDAWTVPPDGDIARAVGLLREAERPVILAGGGVLTGVAGAELRSLAEATGAAVATTAQGKSAFPNDHPLSLGVLGVFGTAPAAQFCAQADVLLAVGCRFTDLTASSYRQGAGLAIPPTQLLHIDVDPLEIGKNYPPTMALIGDARRTLRVLCDAVLAESDPVAYEQAPYTRAIADACAEWDATLASARGDDLEPATVAAVLEEVREFLDPDAFIVSGGGTTQAHILQAFPFTVPGTHITTAGFGARGFALPAALGAQLAHPMRQVLAVCDAAEFLSAAPELVTAVAQHLPIVILVCRYPQGEDPHELRRVVYGADRAPAPSAATDGDPRLADVAEALGCHAQRITSAEEVQTALAAAFASEQTAVVECVVNGQAPPRPVAGWWDIPVPTYLADRRAEYDRAREEQQW